MFLSSILTGPRERKLVLESCLRCKAWGLLEMYVLLTDDVVELDQRHEDWNLPVDTVKELNSHLPVNKIKLPYIQYPDLFLSLLIARCPVSNHTCTSRSALRLFNAF